MQQNPYPLHSADKARDQPGKKTNEDYNGTPPAPKDPVLPITHPDKEVPDITSDYEELTDDDTTGEDAFGTDKRKNYTEPTYLDILDE